MKVVLCNSLFVLRLVIRYGDDKPKMLLIQLLPFLSELPQVLKCIYADLQKREHTLIFDKANDVIQQHLTTAMDIPVSAFIQITRHNITV